MCKQCGATIIEIVNGKEVCAYCGTPISDVKTPIYENDVSCFINGGYRKISPCKLSSKIQEHEELFIRNKELERKNRKMLKTIGKRWIFHIF